MFKITPSYWCTWSTQNRDAERLNEEVKKNNPAAFLGDQGAQLARATMNEESIFSQGGWADYFPEIRGDLFFMLDDGWDIAYGIHPDKNRKLFGSLILNEERFPLFKGDNKTRLKQLSAALIARGWRGLGLEFVPSRKVESAVIRSLFDERTEMLEIGAGDRILLSGRTIGNFASKTDESRPAFVIDVAYRD